MVSDRTLQSVFGMRSRAVALWGDTIRGFSTLVVCVVLAALAAVYADILRTTATVRTYQDFGVFYESASDADPSGTPNLNPPHFNLLVRPLTFLERESAFVVWLAGSVLALMSSLSVISRTLALGGWATFALWALAFASAPMIATLVTGQVALVLLVPFTLAWRCARQHRWVAASAWVGACAAIKPFFLLFAVYLLLRRQRGAAVTLTAVVAGAFGTGLAVYGPEAYRVWVTDVSSVTWAEHYMNASVLGVVERTLSATDWPQVPLVDWPRLVGPVWVVICTGVAIGGLSRARVGSNIDEQFLLVTATALLLAPLGWVYYAWFLVGPATAVVVSASTARMGWRAGGVVLAGAGLLVPLFVPAMAIEWRWGVGTVTLGSIYFWSLFSVWCAMTHDGHEPGSGPNVSSSHTMPPTQHPPGPPSRGLTGQLDRMRHDPLRFLVELRRAYGDVVQFRVLHKSVLLLAHPEHIRHVLQTDYRRYTNASTQTRSFGVLRAFLGNGLLTSEGAYWLRQRRIMQPAFHRDRIAAFGDAMTRATTSLLDRWERDRADTVNVTAEMSHLTLSIVGETLMSSDVGSETQRIEDALAVATRAASDALTRFSVLPGWVPTRGNLQIRQALATLDEIVLGLIQRRRRTGEDPGDLLSMLMAARDEETGEGMTDAQLRDEVMTIFIAGHETSALALGWTFYLLANYPEEAVRLRSELADTLGGRVPRVDDLHRLPFTSQVVQESLRLYPPVWIIPRYAVEDDEIDGYRVPGGAFVLMSPFVTHRHPAFWQNPDTFAPSRFGKGWAEAMPPMAYCPFGAGPRQCIGNSFAAMQAQLVVATVAQRCVLERVDTRPIDLNPSITLRSSEPIHLKRRVAVNQV